ncbi:hypothetical protein RR48_11316 [Papilio machaon]|uniref:Uncharacterized protein n=1 Tax=Papilio machaon TaxID=76193 RepID=A0A194QMR8_PAPMA|nr:hypothetical protein RR48_11316 [Papilio machaon]
MLKFLTHKLRTHSLNEENVSEKVEERDSGTESDDEAERAECADTGECCYCLLRAAPAGTRRPAHTLSNDTRAFATIQVSTGTLVKQSGVSIHWCTHDCDLLESY